MTTAEVAAAVAALTLATTNLTIAVGGQQTDVRNAVAAFAAVIERVNNGLNNVSNTPDSLKPVSTAVQLALNAKQPTLVSGENIRRVNGVDLMGPGDIVIARSATELNYVTYENRGTLRGLSPQVNDFTMVESLGLFRWVNTKVFPESDELAINTASGQWVLQGPAWNLIQSLLFAERAFDNEWREAEPARFAAYLLAHK